MTNKLDFEGLQICLNSQLENVLKTLFPSGEVRGNEFRIGSVLGEKGNSLVYTLSKGCWIDNGDSTQRGGDILSLYAAHKSISMGEAFKQLAVEFGFDSSMAQEYHKNDTYNTVSGGNSSMSLPETPLNPYCAPPQGTAPPKIESNETGRWIYRDKEGFRLRLITRVQIGGKNPRKLYIPCSYRAENGWEKKHWPVSFQTLYGLEKLKSNPVSQVIITEGEKACDSCQEIVGENQICMTWQGGAKAVDSIDFSAVFGRRVLLWPDNDEPGIEAMNILAAKLFDNKCDVKIIDPSDRPNKWDAADSDFSSYEEFKAWAVPRRSIYKPPQPEIPPAPPELDTPEQSYQSLWQELGLTLMNKKGDKVFCNVLNASKMLKYHLRNNKFHYDTFFKRGFTDYKSVGTGTGKLVEMDDNHDISLLIDLQGKYGFHTLGITTASCAVGAAAKMSGIKNAPQDEINSVEWDGEPRIDNFLHYYMGVVDTPLTTFISKAMILAIDERIFEPGCQVDMAFVFEGAQGVGKTQAVKALASPRFYTSTSTDPTSKDFYQQIIGKTVVEIEEMNSFSSAKKQGEIKAAISKSTDDFRLPYGRAITTNPRTNIFIITTNDTEGYLIDDTGNRRYLPVRVAESHPIKLAEIRADRLQIFAEARVRMLLGERHHENEPASLKLAQAERQAKVEGTDEVLQVLESIAEHKRSKVSIRWIKRLLINSNKIQFLGRFPDKKIATILRSLGYESQKNKKDFVDEISTRFWQTTVSLHLSSVPKIDTSEQREIPNFAPQESGQLLN